VPGLVGMNLMSVSFFSVGALLVGYRERGVLKRLRATPLTPATFIAAQILNRYAITLAQALILFVLAWLVFGVRPRGSPAAVLVALTVGLLAFMTLGFTIASLARTQASATGIANVFFLPALFLGGAYFPVETFPPLLRTIGTSLPLAPFLEGFRGIYSRGLPLDAVSGPLLIVAGWGVVGALLSVRLFRWQ
jgi:ABC-2 type transport system permease protein